MKDESIRRLLQSSQLEPSEDFRSQLMEAFDRKVAQKMRLKLYLLMAGITVFFLGIALALVISGFSFQAFGWAGSLPKIGTIIGISILGFLLLSYSSFLLRLGKGEIV